MRIYFIAAFLALAACDRAPDKYHDVKYDVEWEVICCGDFPVSKCKTWCEGDGKIPADGLLVFAAYNGLYDCTYSKGELLSCSGDKWSGDPAQSSEWRKYRDIAMEKAKARTPVKVKYCQQSPKTLGCPPIKVK